MKSKIFEVIVIALILAFCASVWIYVLNYL